MAYGNYFGHVQWIDGFDQANQFFPGIRFRIGRLFGRNWVRVPIHGRKIAVRPHSPDLKVARLTLGGEFSMFADVLDRGFAGLIIDAGAYIGTSALAISESFGEDKQISLK